MNKTDTPTSGEIVIPINNHLQRVQYLILPYYVVIAALMYWVSDFLNLGDWLSSPTVWGLYSICFAGTLFLAYVNKQKKIVFSSSEQAVYSQSYFGKKQLMAFADIGAIKPYSSAYGMTYFGLFGRDNLFQRSPPRISPNYTAAKKSDALYREFEQMTLPELRAMISNRQAPRPEKQLSPATTGLTYYTAENGGYELKNTYNRTALDKAIPVVLIGVALLILLSPEMRLKLFNVGIGMGLAGLLMGFLLTEKKRFQDGELISEYKWGWWRKAYPITQFSTYQITHRKHNFIYVGTDINLVFRIDGKQKTIFLSQMRKTEKIEALINETNYIMDTLMQ